MRHDGDVIDCRTALACDLIETFLDRTGVTSDRPCERYLWTDAFAVLALLAFERATGDPMWRGLAIELVDRVHHTLGQHRPDSPESGWLSGLSAEEGEIHPTVGGLRIGKPLPERSPGEPYEPSEEWDRDGQYFHYLTKWMQALHAVARATGDPTYDRYARELAVAAAGAFVWQPSTGPKRMYWKMSVDLARPLVPSMGHHDPLEGWVIVKQLRRVSSDNAALEAAEETFASMLEDRDLTTTDPLGIGGLLLAAWQLVQCIMDDPEPDKRFLIAILDAAERGIARYANTPDLLRSADDRLAFRELGLSIGFSALERIHAVVRACPALAEVSEATAALRAYRPLASTVVGFWRMPDHRLRPLWLAHENINDVMLATALVPAGFLDVVRPDLGKAAE